MLLFPLFIFGLAIGSFLNVAIDRIPQGKSVIKGRSYCDSCRKTLSWKDLVPVLSFIYLKGKCRYCRHPLSFFYPFIEILTGILFVLIENEDKKYKAVAEYRIKKHLSRIRVW